MTRSDQIAVLQGLLNQNEPLLPGGIFSLEEAEPRLIEGTVYDPVVCLILQGSKETTSHKGTVHLSAGDLLIVAQDTPVTACITSVPYHALIVPVDLACIRMLCDTVDDAADAISRPVTIMDSTQVTESILEILSRLLSLEPGSADACALAPLYLTELHYRLLTSAAGGMLRRLRSPTSQESRIAAVVATIRRQFAKPLRLTDLAREAGMGQSTFHHHFKSLTGTTPLQFQKDIRLSEAMRLLTEGARSVTEVAFAVGYESSAQFSREFSRRFGRPPKQVLSQQGGMAANRRSA